MWLSPIELVREVLELVIHAKEFAKNFEGVDTVEFKCTWYGLRNRLIADFDPLISWHPRKCHVDKRSTRAEATLAVISASPLSIVSELASPLTRLFDGWEITPQKIDSWKKRFKVF